MIGSAFWGCGAPNVDYGNCAAQCDEDEQACSAGKVCRAGYCVEPNFTGSCTAGGGTTAEAGAATAPTGGGTGIPVTTGGISSTATAESSGTSSTSTGGVTGNGSSSVTGGSANGGSNATAGGAASGGSGGASTTDGGATANGGASEPSSSSLGGSTSAGSNPAGGAPGLGGTSTVRGTDTGGADAGPNTRPSCTEANTPQVLTRSLPQACVGEVFSAQLTASGGGDYVWTATIPSEIGLSLTKGGELTGTLSKRGEFSFEVSVTDETTGCTATPRRITLSVGDDAFVVCPTIELKGKTASALAPESCVAWPYAAEFEVAGGTQPFTWEALNAPAGVTFDSTSQLATGNPTAAGDLVLQVTDATGRIVRRSFAVPLREKCWFAYISNEASAQRLHLVDPMLGAHLQRPSSSTTDLIVSDFKFSPDGKFVAYRVKDASNVYSLWLWQAPGWEHEQPINLGGSVTHYAWSNNSQTLAAAIDTGSGTLLGGISVAGVPRVQTVPGIQGLLALTAIPAPVQSEITWYGSEGYVAFHSKAFPEADFRTMSTASYGIAGFESVDSRPTEIYDSSLALRSSALGVYPLVPAASVVYFIGVGIDVRIDHANIAIAPGGDYVALQRNRTLNIYPPTASTFPYLPASTLASASACDTLLGWAEARQRLTCIDEAQQSVVAYDIDVAAQTVSQSIVAGSQTYVSSTWQGNRRLMSSNGRWAAFSTGDRLYLANLATVEPAIAWSAQLVSASSPVQLSFSPDERFLLAHHGSVFSAYVTGSSEPISFSHAAAASALPCQEDESWADDWCGQVPSDPQLAWSSDSQLFAFVSNTQELVAYDLRQLEGTGLVTDYPVASKCAGGCAGTGRFQP